MPNFTKTFFTRVPDPDQHSIGTLDPDPNQCSSMCLFSSNATSEKPGLQFQKK